MALPQPCASPAALCLLRLRWSPPPLLVSLSLLSLLSLSLLSLSLLLLSSELEESLLEEESDPDDELSSEDDEESARTPQGLA